MVNVTAFHDENAGKAECYLDDRLMGTTHEAPFAFMLDEAAFWKHTLMAKAYDTDGNTPLQIGWM